jgi:hypothetical protein
MPGVEADEVGAAAADLRQVRMERRADRDVVEADRQQTPPTRQGRHLKPLLVQLGGEANRPLREDAAQRRAQVEAWRQPANPGVAGLRRAQRCELSEALVDVLSQQTLVTVGCQPKAHGVRQRPEDAIVVERQLVAVREQAQRGELPRHPFGHAVVEIAAQEFGSWPGGRHTTAAGTGSVRRRASSGAIPLIQTT